MSLGCYRYGFNGQEKSTEVGTSNYTAQFWVYDSRIGRRWNVDPRPNPSEGAYTCLNNSPIWRFDAFGDTTVVPIPIFEEVWPDIYENHYKYIRKHPDEAVKIGKYVHLYFNYDPDRARNEKRRQDNKRANPLFNPNPAFYQEDEVAPASTKQGGARSVRSIVSRIQNRQHGFVLSAAVRLFNMKEDDVFDVILIPKEDEGAPVTAPNPIIPIIPTDSGKRKNPSYDELMKKYEKKRAPYAGTPFSSIEKLVKDLFGSEAPAGAATPVPAPVPVVP